MCMCMYVCMYIRIYVHTYICTYSSMLYIRMLYIDNVCMYMYAGDVPTMVGGGRHWPPL